MSIMEIQLKHNFIIPILLFLVSCSTSEVNISEDTNLFNPIPTSTTQHNTSNENNLKNTVSIPSPTPRIISIPTPDAIDLKSSVEQYPLLVKPWGVPQYLKKRKGFIPSDAINKIEPKSLDLNSLVDRINNIQINRPGSHFLIPNKNCAIQEDEKFLVIDINVHTVRPIITKQVAFDDLKDNHYCWYIENQYLKDVNLQFFKTSIEKFNLEIHPYLQNIFNNPEINPYIYIVITNLNPGLAGYYSDSNNYPFDIHYGSNDVDIIFIDIDQVKNGEESFLSTLTHELSHLYQSQIDSYSNSWIKEGTAELITDSVGFKKQFNSNIFSKPISLNSLYIPDVQQYDYFTSFFLYLKYRFDPLNLYELLQYRNKSIQGIIEYLKTNHNYQNNSDDLLKEWGLEILNCHIEKCSLHADFINTTPINTINDFELIEMQPLSLQFYKILEANAISIQMLTEINNIENQIWWSGNGDLIDNTITFEFEINDLSNYSLSFDTYFDIEDRFDLVYLQISKDAGESWEIISTPAMNSQHSSFYALGDHYTTKIEDWINEEILIGNVTTSDKLLIRFEYITDDSVNNNGFYVKDIELMSSETNIIDPNKIYLGGFRNHVDLVRPACFFNVIQYSSEKGLSIKDSILIDSNDLINYDFTKDKQLYVMLQCNDFEGSYSTSINLQYTV